MAILSPMNTEEEHMSEKEKYHIDFETTTDVPGDVWWVDELEAYFPLPGHPENTEALRLSKKMNSCFESYIARRNQK